MLLFFRCKHTKLLTFRNNPLLKYQIILLLLTFLNYFINATPPSFISSPSPSPNVVADERQTQPPPPAGIDLLSEQQLFQPQDLPADLTKGYGNSVDDGKIERIDNPVEVLPTIEQSVPGQEVTLDFKFPDVVQNNVVTANKEIHNYSVQRKIINTSKKIIRKYEKNIFVNTLYNTKIQRVNHPKTVITVVNTVQEVHQPKLKVAYSSSNTTSVLPTREEPTEEVHEVEKKTVLVPIYKPLCIETINSPVSPDFEIFKARYGKKYPDPCEEAKRRGIWDANLKYINNFNLRYNRGLETFTLGMNKFGDLTTDEFSKKYNGFQQQPINADDPSECAEMHVSANIELPTSVDWRTRNIVAAIPDQDVPNPCGSCWAFSTVGSVEAQLALKTGKLVHLSEQNLIDCSKPEGNGGCDDGSINIAFNYIKKNGLMSNVTYPYTGLDEEQCKYDPSKNLVKLRGCRQIPPGDENALTNAIANVGPISVCIDANHTTYKHYQYGVFQEPECSSSSLNHGVLAIGYGVLEGKEYYLIKNSISETWGDKGYMLVAKNKNNTCGVASAASYPVLE